MSSTHINRFWQFLAETLGKECAIKRLLAIPPLLNDVSTLPGETPTPKILSVNHAAYRKWHCFGLLYLWHSSTNFNYFWHLIAMEFRLSQAHLIIIILCTFAIFSLICCEITAAEMTHFWRYWLFVNMLIKEDKILTKIFSLSSRTTVSESFL